jgi:peptide/nickel transport system permease protein
MGDGSLNVETQAGSSISAFAIRPRRTFLQNLTYLIRRNPVSDVGALIILIVIIVAIGAPWIAPYDPIEQPFKRLLPPSLTNLLGTDEFGRDVLSRIIYGSRVSLYVGVLAIGIALAGGLVLGLVAGYFGGMIDSIVMRVMDVLYAFPFIVLAIVITGVLGPTLTNAMIAIGIVYAPRFASVVRAPILSVKQEDYILACKAMGVPDTRAMVRHVLPNVLSPLIVQTSLAVSTAILSEAALSFLGLGAQPPTPSWGSMLQTGRVFMVRAPWVAIFPGLAIVFTVLGFNLLGDGLRDILDPRLRHD